MKAAPINSNPDYLAALGLQRAPFIDQLDDRFFYADPALVQRLDLLQHLIQFGDMLLGVVGPSGSGKSTLLGQLLARGGTTWRTCRVNGAQTQQPADLLTQLADCFGLDRNSGPERLQADLLRICQTLRHNGQIAVVMIDDAHLLQDAALKSLLDLGGAARDTLKLLRVVLFSQPGLERRVTQAGWHSPVQPLLHSLDVPSFNDHQTAAYLMYRLAVAGYSGESPFSLTEIRALHKAAAGLPGRLNPLAHETLLDHAKRRTSGSETSGLKVGGRLRLRPAAGAVVAGILGLGGISWYLQDNANDAPLLETTAHTAPPTQPAAVPEPQAEPVAAAPESGTFAQPDATRSGPSSPPLEKGQGDEAADPVASAQAMDQRPANQEKRAMPESDALGPEGQPQPKPETSGPQPNATGPQDLPSVQAEAAETAATAPGSTPKLPPAADSVRQSAAITNAGGTPVPTSSLSQAEKATAEKEPAQPSAPVAEPAPKAGDTAKGTQQSALAFDQPAAKPGTARPEVGLPADVLGAEWLLARPTNHFTLQLIGVRSPVSLRGYLRDHAIPGPVAYFRTRLKGGDWYVLVQGDYPSMETARAGAATLPAAVRKGKPWPRSFTNIHADIRKARD